MNNEFPITGVGTHQVQKFLRDIRFADYRLGHDRLEWQRDYDVPEAVRLVDDFLGKITDVWDETVAGGTIAVADGLNGLLVLTPHTDDDDTAEMYQTVETFRLDDGHPLYFEIRFKLTDAEQCDFYAGLVSAAGLWNGSATDGVYFRKDDGDLNLDFTVLANGTETDVDTGVNVANLTFLKIGFHWDGDGTIRYFVFTDGDEPVVCVAAGEVTTGYAQDETLRVAFGVRNGAGASKVATVDYVKCVQRRVI